VKFRSECAKIEGGNGESEKKEGIKYFSLEVQEK
jgi:hypothetical protein